MNNLESARIRYLSPPAPVSMADEWFGIAGLDHFWIQRRFQVLCRIAGETLTRAQEIAEIGCGHGMVQRQIEDKFRKNVTGFDLNERALQQSVSRMSEVCCYDVFQKQPEYGGRFDAIVLFDVIEHLPDEDAFLDAIRFHLAPGGKLLINVPALEKLWSRYDVAAGHYRRYDSASLTRATERNGLITRDWTYWGMPLVTLLQLRKIWLEKKSDDQVIASGMDSRWGWMNRILLLVSQFEPIPQHLIGTSLMAVLEKRR